MRNQSPERKQEPQIKWNEMNSQQDGWPMLWRPSPRTALSVSTWKRWMSFRTTSKQMWRTYIMHMQCFPRWNVLLMLAVQPMCLSSGFSFSCASCHELSLFCVYCRAFLWSICSSCAGSQHNTGMPVCPSTQSIPKALNFSSLPMEWVGFADMDTEGLCPPSPSYSWAVFLWWCSHGATALPCYCRICKTALLCLIHNLPLIIPLFFFSGYKPSIWQH